jgi:hypothetical protein
VAVTAQDVKDTFVEFSATSDTLIERFLAQAERRINTIQWGEKADDGTLWLTAHLLKIECQLRTTGAMAAGPVSQQKVGDLSVSYKIPENASKTWLASTAYGREYLELRALIFPTRVLGTCDATGC